MKPESSLKDLAPGVHSGGVHSTAACQAPQKSGLGSGGLLQGEQTIRLSFDEFYQSWFHEVCRWARGMGGLHADVEDIAQEVFIVVRRKLEDFDGAHPKAWLFRITQRTVSDYRRRAWLRRAVRPAAEFLNQLVDPADGPREVVELREAEKRVAAALERMSTVRRMAFILYEIEGYTGEEIAELEGVPVATVYTRLHHARRDFFKWMNLQPHQGFE